MLLHFLHSLHPCNSAIADDCKDAGGRATQGRKLLLHFLHSLHPCNSAVAEEQKLTEHHGSYLGTAEI